MLPLRSARDAPCALMPSAPRCAPARADERHAAAGDAAFAPQRQERYGAACRYADARTRADYVFTMPQILMRFSQITPRCTPRYASASRQHRAAMLLPPAALTRYATPRFTQPPAMPDAAAADAAPRCHAAGRRRRCCRCLMLSDAAAMAPKRLVYAPPLRAVFAAPPPRRCRHARQLPAGRDAASAASLAMPLR